MIADRKQAFTQYGGARPFGISLMLAGVNKDKSYLYATDVTGNYFAYKANAIGENDEKIKEILRKDYKEGISTEEGIKFCMKIFKDVLGKNFDVSRFEVGSINFSDEKLKRMQGDELKRFVK
jgi:proteasome alpha subunit